VLADGAPAGEVTSGTFSPTLEEGIALARVERKAVKAEEFAIRIRDRDARAVRVRKTFV
jgi:aminomethyltransferase